MKISSKFLPLVLLSLTISIFISCGSDDDPVSSNTTITGTISDSSLSKARFASSDTLTAVVKNVDSGQTFTATVSGRSYSVNVTTGINVSIEILNGGTVILSRVLDSETTKETSVSAKINVLTHVQAKMAIAKKAAGGSLRDAIISTNGEMFGSSTILSETAIGLQQGLSTLESKNAVFASQVATLGQLVSAYSASSTSITSTFTSLNNTLSSSTVATISSGFNTQVNSFSSSTAEVFGSAFEGAKNSGFVTTTGFSTYQATITNTTVTTAIETAKKSPAFGTLGTPLSATPGVVFSFTFPAATTGDILGISGYTGAMSSTPSGLVSFSDLTLKFAPSQGDVGNTYTYTVTAAGANGKSKTASISIVVKAQQITGLNRMLLQGSSDTNNMGYYKVDKGPILYDNHFYLISEYSSSMYRLEKYSQAGIDAPSTSALSVVTSWNLPSGSDPTDLVFSSNTAYIANTNTSVGLVAYDVDSTSTSIKYQSTSMTGSYLTLGNSKIYNLGTSPDYAVRSADNALSSVSTDTTLTSKALSLSASKIGSYGDYLYLANSMSASFYKFVSNSPTALASEFSTTVSNSYLGDHSSVSGAPLYAISSLSATSLTITNDILSSTSLPITYSLTSSMSPSIANSFYAYHSSGLSDVTSFSLQSGEMTATATDETKVYYTNTSGLKPMIINKPEGVTTGKSGAYLYFTGQYSSTQEMTSTSVKGMTGTWYIKSFLVEPTN